MHYKRPSQDRFELHLDGETIVINQAGARALARFLLTELNCTRVYYKEGDREEIALHETDQKLKSMLEKRKIKNA